MNKYTKSARNWSKSEVQTTWSLPQCGLVCALWLHKQKWKWSLDVWHRGSFSIVSKVIVKGLAGVWAGPSFRPLSFTAQTPDGIHSDTPSGSSLSRLWAPLECAPSPSISTLHLQHMPTLCLLTLLHSFSTFMSLAVIFHPSESLFIIIFFLS